MSRIDRDQLGLLLATAWSLRSTCARRRVGCVIFDAEGKELSSGYNGPPSGSLHCIDHPCPGASRAPGQVLEHCEAVHAEINACLQLADSRRAWTVYCTASPCRECVKAILNTGARRIVFIEEYPHPEAKRRWFADGKNREWLRLPTAFGIHAHYELDQLQITRTS